jgi:hypothetical protein
LRAIVFARVARARQEIVLELLERGSSVLIVLDDVTLSPADLGLDLTGNGTNVTALLPVLPSPLAEAVAIPEAWDGGRWGAILGLFPFPGARDELEARISQLHRAGASFAVSAPLLLTPKDRHRILDACDGSGIEDQMENCLFHADVSRGLHALERSVGVVLHEVGMEPTLFCLAPSGYNSKAVRTAAELRLWARRLDQCYEESSWGWRLRRAASALDRLHRDPALLAEEDNLRVIPGFDEWVESFTRSLWNGGDPVESAWKRWSDHHGLNA